MKSVKKLFSMFAQPFKSRGRFDPGVVLVCLLINSLVFVNASLHDPRIGYDADGHLLLMGVKERFTATTATMLGGAMGLCALSRQ